MRVSEAGAGWFANPLGGGRRSWEFHIVSEGACLFHGQVTNAGSRYPEDYCEYFDNSPHTLTVMNFSGEPQPWRPGDGWELALSSVPAATDGTLAPFAALILKRR